MHILLRSQMRFEKPQGCGCSGGLGLFQGQCHTWNGIMASFTQAGTFWALRMLLDPQGAPGIAAGMVPRSWSQPGCAAVSHQTLTPLPAAGRGGSHGIPALPVDFPPLEQPRFQCCTICSSPDSPLPFQQLGKELGK